MGCSLYFVVALAAAALPPAPAAARTASDEAVRRLAEQADGPQANFALARLVEIALGEDGASARAATEALPAFHEEGDLAIDRVLRSAPTLAARCRALELVAARRRPEDRGLFVGIVTAEAPTPLRIQALELLAADREALVLVEPALRTSDVKVQARALRVLGQARLPAALARAKEVLTPESRHGLLLKIAAIEVLRDDGGRDSIRRLVDVASHELGEVREFAFKSLLVMDRGAVLVLLLPMLAPSAPANDVMVALDVVATVGVGSVPEIQEAVRGALDHPDTEVQVAATRAIAAVGDLEGLSRLERAASGLDPTVAAAAIEAITLLRREDPAWRERLRKLLQSQKAAIRIAAARSLGLLSDAKSEALLVSLLDDDDWRVRESAAEGLGTLRSRSSIEPMIAHLDGERLRVRGALVHALRRTSGMRFHDAARDWRRWWEQVRDTFVVPPLSQIEELEKRLATNAARSTTTATFYGIPVESDHLALVIDVSGSMSEPDAFPDDPAATAAGKRDSPRTKLDVAKREVAQLLERLPENAALNMLFFSDEVQRWQRSLVPLSRSQTARANAFVRERQAAGSTNLYDALAEALSDPQVDTIYLLSDGNPTTGKLVDPVALRAEVRRRNSVRHVRIHVVSIGHESALLRHLGADSGGTYTQR